MNDTADLPMTFRAFYRTTYRYEHRHPANLALHVIGVFLGLGVIAASLTVWPWWTIVAFPAAHGVPGLIGHRLFERNQAVGDIRITRKDHPLWWFIIANHLMAVRVLTFRW